MSSFEGFSSLNEDSILCPHPRPDHHCSGRGQSKGTGTGDKEDGHGVDEGLADVIAVRRGREGSVGAICAVVTLGKRVSI